MTVLGIDASASGLALGILHGGRPLAEVRLLRPQVHSRVMLPLVRELLARAGVSPRDLELVAVAAGPGSYTGLRLAATAAKVLAWAAGAPVVGVDGLAVLAAGVAAAHAPGTGDPPVAALLPARRGELYGRLYRASWPPEARTPLLEGPVAHVVAELVRAAGEAAVFVGEGALQAADEVAAAGGQLPRDPALHLPQGLLVARLGLLAAGRGEAGDPRRFVPRYAGPPPAREPAVPACPAADAASGPGSGYPAGGRG